MERVKFGMRRVLICLIAAAFPLASVQAATIGVTVNAGYQFMTEGNLFDCLSTDPGWPCLTVNRTSTGITTASLVLTDAASAADDPAHGPPTRVTVYSSIAATEGHVGLSVTASASGIGNAQAFADVDWNDTLTVGGAVIGTPVTLLAEIGIEAEFLGEGGGSEAINGCFNGSIFGQLCFSGSDDSDSGRLILPRAATRQFTAHVGDILSLSGEFAGGVTVDNRDTAPGNPLSDWSVTASNSAHFMITSLTPGVELTLASGCSITNGYGCDPPPSSAPEPHSLLLIGAGLLFVGRLAGAIRKL